MLVKSWGHWCRGVAVVAAVLVATELGLRLGFGFGRPLLYAVDVPAGYVTAPDQDLRRFGARIAINSFSMRSESFKMPKPRGRKRLLFVGDSVTFGTTYVDQGVIFTGLIKQTLQRRYGETVDVLNASAGGWAPANEFGYLHSRGTFDADWVIFVLNTNDLTQPFAVLDVSPQFPTQLPVSAIGEVLQRYVEPRLVAGIRIGDPGSNADQDPDLLAEAAVLDLLSNAHVFAQSHGAEFAVVFSPTDYFKLKTRAWQESIAKLHEWSDHSGVQLIDMTTAFSAYGRDQVYFDGIHLRPFGHRIIAGVFVQQFRGLPQAATR